MVIIIVIIILLYVANYYIIIILSHGDIVTINLLTTMGRKVIGSNKTKSWKKVHK